MVYNVFSFLFMPVAFKQVKPLAGAADAGAASPAKPAPAKPAPAKPAAAAAAAAKPLPPHIRVMQMKGKAVGEASIAGAYNVVCRLSRIFLKWNDTLCTQTLTKSTTRSTCIPVFRT